MCRRAALVGAAWPCPSYRTGLRDMWRATVAGHICADLQPSLGGQERIVPGAIVEVGPLDIRPGGSVANTGGDLAALGAQVLLVADLGDDELGSTVLRALLPVGADCQGIRQVMGLTTSYSLVFEPPGVDRSFWHHVGANASFDGARVQPEAVDLVHLGYPALLPLMYADCGSGLRDILARVREAGATTSLDLSAVAPGSPAAQVDWRLLLHRTAPLVDVMSPSVDDLVSALGVARPKSLSEVRELGLDLLELGGAVVLLTNGALGMHLFTAHQERLSSAGRCLSDRSEVWSDREVYLPASASGSLVTTGAGDAATAGLLFGILSGSGAEEAAVIASRAAALKVAGSKRPLRYAVTVRSS
jgi:sugar/nucleoside kinase (ribokinase family)